MSAFNKKPYLKNYQRRLEDKFKGVCETAADICLHLQEISSKLEQKKQHLMNHEDVDYFNREYPKCCKELEAYDQKFFLIVNILSSLEDESHPEVDDDKVDKGKHSPDAEDITQAVSEILCNPPESDKTSSTHVSNDSPSTDSGIFFKLHSDGSDDLEKEKLQSTNSKTLLVVSSSANDDSPTLLECTASATEASENCDSETSQVYQEPVSSCSYGNYQKKPSMHKVSRRTCDDSPTLLECVASATEASENCESETSQVYQEPVSSCSFGNQHKKPSMCKVSKRTSDDSSALSKCTNASFGSASTVSTSVNYKSTSSLDVSLEDYQESVSSYNSKQHIRPSVCNGPKRTCTDEESYISCNENNGSHFSSASTNSFFSIGSMAHKQLNGRATMIKRDCDIPVLDIPIGSVVVVGAIKNFQNPSDFWIQLENHEFEECLLSSRAEKVELSNLKQLKYCLAVFRPTGLYYRGKILCVYGKGEEARVKVFYIDCGIVSIVYATELVMLPDALYDYPAQAVHCCLSGIAPVGQTWCQEALEKFQNAVTYSDPNLRATVVSKEENLYAVNLDIFMKIEDKSEMFDLGQMLCLMNLAVSTKAASGTVFANYDMNAATSSIVSDSEGDYENINFQDQFPNLNKCGQETHMKESSGVVYQSNSQQSFLQKTVESYGKKETPDVDAHVRDVAGPVYSPESESNSYVEERTYYNSNYAEIHKDFEFGDSDDEIYLSDDSNIERTSSSCLSQETGDAELQNSVSCISVPSENSRDVNVDKSDISESESYFDVVVPAPQPLFIEDDLMIVIPSVIYSPSYFYCNTSTGNPLDLDELRDQMTNFYENPECSSHLKVDVNAIKENMFFAHLYEDNCWYRVQINYICDKNPCDTPKAVVLYIDYGNESVVNMKDLKPLIERFVKYPAMAVPCSLAFIGPKSTDSIVCNSNELPHLKLKWDKQATDKFLEIAGDEKPLTAQVSKFQRLDGRRTLYEVLLWKSDDKLINDMLVDEGFANYRNINNIPRQLKWKKSENLLPADLSNWDPMAEDYHSTRNSYGVNVSDVEVATVGYKATDEQYVCKFYASNGTCYRGEKCPYEHISSNCVGETVDQDAVYVYENGIPLPDEGLYCLLQVSCVLTAGHFYVVFPFGSVSIDEVRSKPDVSMAYQNEFEELSSAMREHYSKALFDENTAVALANGSLVVARSNFDGSWYRGRVLEVLDIDKPIEVFYVDFGYTEWVERRSVREIQPQFLHCPFQAVEAFLANVEPRHHENGGKWTKKAKSAFEKLVVKQTFIAYINQKIGSTLFVTLKKVSEDRTVIINDVLVEEGFAQISASRAYNAKSECQETEKDDRLSWMQPG